MNYEKLRLRVGYLLLGEKRAAEFVVLFPKILLLLQVLLWVTGILNAEIFENKEYGFTLALLFGIGSVSLYFVTACFELLRDRWLYCRMKKSKKAASSLLAEFSFRDFLLAVRLSVLSRVRCVMRTVLFLAFPVAVCVYCFELSGFAMSRGKWAVLIAGCALLLALGGVFSAVSACSVFAAKKLCCFDLKHTFAAYFAKTAVLDRCCFALMNFRLTFYPLWGAKKELAALIDARFSAAKNGKKTNGELTVNKL